MRKITNLISTLSIAGILAGSFATASPVMAASALNSTQKLGNWVVTDLVKSSSVEAFKVDRQLVAWTERNGDTRTLNAFDGVNVRRLATLPVSDWNEKDGDNDFVDPIMGNFDVADGLVVWTQNDGHDREIYSWNGDSVARLSDNSYDDRHPITSAGSVAWTSQPGQHYNLVVSKNGVVSKIDTYHVMNYAFSGKNLFWMKFTAGDTTDKVYRYDGSGAIAIGIGDDRPIRNYFIVDGKGSAAWEYSTNRWNDGRRIMYNSYNGEAARSIIGRLTPPYATTLEDVDGGEIVMNSYDYYYQKLESRVSLIRSNGTGETVIASKSALAKARYMDGGLVIRHAEPENGTALLKGGSQDFVSYDSIMYNMFEADGPTLAGAMSYGGLMIFNDNKITKVPTTAKVSDLKVVNGDVAWIETAANGLKTLRVAFRGVLVRTSNGPAFMGGHLVKSNAKSTVYFAAEDGKRYFFPSEKQFRTWFQDFSSVRIVSTSALSAMPLGGSALYKPGSRLVKSATSPRVYVIGEDGKLHWITSMSFIENAFGLNWVSKLDLMNDSLFVDYGIGLPVVTVNDYRLALTK
ncbi:hypothetical protein HY633_04415 [Candidatus Uhrbacteria bacterium]|nr:hypothetical protein [Candidatus Uhrbacteria bacterium]